ncbi:MAG: rod shape-determining protein RodA [Gemmatimonadetes bacterium]|nr:rod shape-determining protein RodA [Gemmatimonadota bacterium]
MIKRVVADYPLALLALLLTAYGVAMVYSAGQTDAQIPADMNAWQRQLMWLGAGLVMAFAVSRASVRFLEWVTVPAYTLAIILLLITLAFGSGAGTAKSMSGWLTIGGVRLGQPSELAKVAVVLMLARLFASRREAPKSLVDLIVPAIAVLVPWVLVMAQPDLGTGMVFVGIFFGMMFWAGTSWPLLLLVASPAVSLILAFSTGLWGAWFLLLIALVLWFKPYVVEGVVLIVANVVMGVAAPVLWDNLKPHQQSRILVFIDPQQDPKRTGYHVIQSQIAIGSGGLTGRGYLEGTQKEGAFLPAQTTDFIFAVLGEELGFLGVSAALLLFVFLFLRVIRVAARANDGFSSLVAFGLLSSWFVHVVVNVGMTLNLMPITGIPLPFFSYGGSFMLSCWLAVGILVRVSAEGRGEADALPIGLRR